MGLFIHWDLSDVDRCMAVAHGWSQPVSEWRRGVKVFKVADEASSFPIGWNLSRINSQGKRRKEYKAGEKGLKARHDVWYSRLLRDGRVCLDWGGGWDGYQMASLVFESWSCVDWWVERNVRWRYEKGFLSSKKIMHFSNRDQTRWWVTVKLENALHWNLLLVIFL